MTTTNEKIEVGLDPQSQQVTIVVGNESNSVLAVQSVVVLKANFAKNVWDSGHKKASFCSRRSSSNLSNNSRRNSKLRSELLRPESPLMQRDQPPRSRGRESSRSERSVSSRTSRHSRSQQSYHRRGPSTNSSLSNKNMDSSATLSTDLAPKKKETKTYSYKKSVNSTRNPFSFRTHFRNQRVDPVLLVADV